MHTWVVHSDFSTNGNFFSQTLLTFPTLPAPLQLAWVTLICWLSQVALENKTRYIKMIFCCCCCCCYCGIDSSSLIGGIFLSSDMHKKRGGMKILGLWLLLVLWLSCEGGETSPSPPQLPWLVRSFLLHWSMTVSSVPQFEYFRFSLSISALHLRVKYNPVRGVTWGSVLCKVIWERVKVPSGLKI